MNDESESYWAKYQFIVISVVFSAAIFPYTFGPLALQGTGYSPEWLMSFSNRMILIVIVVGYFIPAMVRAFFKVYGIEIVEKETSAR